MAGFMERFFNARFLLKALLYFLGFLLLVILFDAVIMPAYTKHGQEYELPDVTERPLEEALEILKSSGFNPIITDSVYDSHLPPGAVVRQMPLPYSTVKKGRRVYLVVSIGEKPIYMPNLIGRTPQDAEFRLREEGLQLNRVVYEFSDFYPRGVVVNQSVPPGELVSRDQKINITVSLGPPPSAQEVPNLVGKSLESAKKELEAIGLRIRKLKYQYKPNLVPGTVISQSASPGTPLTKVKYLDLVVSTDKMPEVQEDTTNVQG